MMKTLCVAESFSKDDVHVWMLHLKDKEELLREYCTILSSDEIDRVFRYKSESSKKRFILARIKLREILSRYTGSSPSNLRFSLGAYGKPSLEGCSEIRFSQANAGDYTLIAVSRNRELGVDLERVVDVDFPAISNRFFSEDEKNALRKLEVSEKLNAFFRIWTRKEAYVKALGVGLSYPMQVFSTSPISENGDSHVYDHSCTMAKTFWRVMEIGSPEGYRAALVAAGSDWRCIYRQL
ncbi:MAG: 4'-phosphopantetheinyl transferase superfamily protein [Gammaproteobacteria bacterium]|nr:MAG: 4'-phosphopantetheinyl transferase superfamily protein [Gammaproteobacteria bacterium]